MPLLVLPAFRTDAYQLIGSGTRGSLHEKIRTQIPARPSWLSTLPPVMPVAPATRATPTAPHNAAAPPSTTRAQQHRDKPIPPALNKSTVHEALGLGMLWEEVPAVASYLWRGTTFCGDYAWKGSMKGVGMASRQNAVLINLQSTKGVSNVMFWQLNFMIAWMLRRPVLLYSDGQIWNLLHSRHMPPSMQVSGVALRDVVANVTVAKGPPIFKDKDDCNAHFQDPSSGNLLSINMLKPPSSWKLPSHPILLLGVGSKNVRTLKHIVPLDCRNKMIQQLKRGWEESDRERAKAITRDMKHFGRCSLRFSMGDPQPDLLRFLQPVLQSLASTKATAPAKHVSRVPFS